VEQLGFEGMPRRLYPCTPTRLSAWLDCPRRYRMSYLDRPAPPKGPPWGHNSLGASVHNALAGWWRLPLAGGPWRPRARWSTAAGSTRASPTKPSRRGSANARSRWWRPTSPGSTRPTSRWGRADGGDPHRQDRGLRPDRPARFPACRTTAGTELVVVDYKTGRHLLTVDDARSSMALALYALAAGRVLRRPCHRVELHHLPTGRCISLAAHRRIAGQAPEPGRGHRAGVRRRRRADARRPARRRYDEVFPPAPARPAAGATTCGTAQRAPPPPSPAT
jgi:hypothetical protein